MINDIKGKGSSESKGREMVSFSLFIACSTVPPKPEITPLSPHQTTFKGSLHVLILPKSLGKNLKTEWMGLLSNYNLVD